MQYQTKRVVTIYTRDTLNAAYRKQLQILHTDQNGLAERDLEVKTCVYSKETAVVFQKKNIKNAFTVVLTGKDGGEKYRSATPVKLHKLFGLIDAMPMRKDEMERRERP